MLRKLLDLAPADRRLLLRAAVRLAAVRLALWALPYRVVERWLARRTVGGGPATLPAERIAWAVHAASRFVPGAARCLPRAVAACHLLRTSGHPATLRLGATRDGAGAFQAHAWVESGGVVLVGDGAIERLAEFKGHSAFSYNSLAEERPDTPGER